MRAADEHPLVPTLKRQLVERQIERREFLRYATLLGMAAPTAYAFVAKVTGEKLIAPAEAQGALPKGGTLRLAMRCQDLKSPHTYSWVESSNSARQVLDYLTVTGVDNVTRPSLVEKWEASPDLKTWTLRLRRNVKWHNGRAVHRRRRRLESEAGARPQDRLLCGRPHEGLSPRGRRHGREGRQGQSQEVLPPLGRQRHPEGRRLHRAPQRQVAAARGARAALPLPAPHPRPGGERRVQGGLERHGRLHADDQRGRPQAGAQGAQGRLLGRRAAPRPARVHRPRRRPRRRGRARSPPSRWTGSTAPTSSSSRRSRRSRTCRCTRSPRPTRRPRACSR